MQAQQLFEEAPQPGDNQAVLLRGAAAGSCPEGSPRGARCCLGIHRERVRRQSPALLRAPGGERDGAS